MSSIGVSPNGRYFVDGAGEPFFWLGDTQWELFRLYRPPQAMTILRDRQAKGFGVILIMLLGVDMTKFGGDGRGAHVNLDGQAPWIGGDPLRPNEEYFRHVDAMIRLGRETGQTFVVGVYHQWQAEAITPANARPWARWVAGRYRDVPGLIWCMYPKAAPESVPVCRELAQGLREGDGGSHLITMHPDPCVASSSFMHEEEWLAFNMIQTCIEYDRIHEAVSADRRRTPAKPVVMAEGGYEGLEFKKLQTPHDIRKQAWWTHLAGGYHVYGHNDAWTLPGQWESWLHSPGSEHLRVFREVVTSCEGWWDMVPDQSIFASGVGEGFALNAAARSAKGRWIIAYLSGRGSVSLRLEGITASKRAVARWVSPIDGARLAAGAFGTREVPSFTPPEGWEDAVLRIEAE